MRRMLALVLVCLGGCGGGVDVGEGPNTPTTSMTPDGGSTLAEEELDDSRGSAGHLPIGYYERQCQWDACEPPPEHRPREPVDPRDGPRDEPTQAGRLQPPPLPGPAVP